MASIKPSTSKQRNYTKVVSYDDKITTMLAQLNAASTTSNNTDFALLEIVKCPSCAKASALISKQQFRAAIERKFESVAGIRLWIDGDFVPDDAEGPKNHEFEEKEQFVMSYESVRDGHRVVYWKNERTGKYMSVEANAEVNSEVATTSFAVEFIFEAIIARRTGELRAGQSGKMNVLSNHCMLTSLIDSRGMNLLMAAIECQKSDIFQQLLKLPFNLDQMTVCGAMAADIAWQKGDQAKLLELLKANSAYPKQFDRLKCSEAVREFTEISESMHEAVAANDYAEVLGILKNHTGLRYFYDTANVSVASTAIRERKIDVYELLIGSNCSVSPLEDFSQLMNDLTAAYSESDAKPPAAKRVKAQIESIHARHFKTLPKAHVMAHLANSHLGHDDQHTALRLKHIRDTLELLDSIDELSLILRVTAAMQNVRNHFDFNRPSIQHMLPTASASSRGEFSTSLDIYVVALGLTETAASLGHEHCHCAIYGTFRNEGRPFAIGNEAPFMAIVAECEKLREKEPIVSWVFDYDRKHWPAELIVRVPHMLVFYRHDKDKLKELMGIFSTLFNYYSETVVPAMTEALSVVGELLRFDELTSPLRAAVTHAEVEFQGQRVKLNAIADTELLEQLSAQQVSDILEKPPVTLRRGLSTHQQDEFYMDRTFIDSDFEGSVFYPWSHRTVLTRKAKAAAKSFDSILGEVSESRLFLLSDYAGAGKSTTMRQMSFLIKKRLPQCWLACIDLKRHTDVYEKIKSESFEACEVLVAILQPLDGFERALLRHLFTVNQVILLLDGLDEIAPKFKDVFLKLIMLINRETRNQQYIATRTQHADELRRKFNCKAHQLLPFDRHQAREFVERLLKAKKAEHSKLQLEKCNDVIGRFGIADNPLMLTMIAELEADGRLPSGNFSRYSLYSDTVELKKDIFAGKGAIAIRDTTQDTGVTLEDAHKAQAVVLLFEEQRFEDFQAEPFLRFKWYESDYTKVFVHLSALQLLRKWQKGERRWSPEALARCGLVTVYRDMPVFTHRTFAEYFAAKFIIESVVEAVEDEEEDLSEKEFVARMKLAIFVLRRHCDINCPSDGVLDFIADYLSTHLRAVTFSERFLRFLERGGTQQFIERMSSDIFKGTVANFVTFVAKFLEVARFDARIFRALMLIRDGRSRMFQISLESYNLSSLPCIELYGIFKRSASPYWYKLTGFGSNLPADQFNLPNDSELEELDFLAKCEVFEGINGGPDDWSDSQDLENFKLFYHFACLIASIEDFPLDKLQRLLESYAFDFNLFTLRSRSMIQKLFEIGARHFAGARRSFAEVLRTIGSWSTRSLLQYKSLKVTGEFTANLELFYRYADDFLIDDRCLMQHVLSDNGGILYFTVLSQISHLKCLFKIHFTAREFCAILVDAFDENLREIDTDVRIEAFDEFCGENFEFPRAFQLALNHCGDLRKIFRLIRAYEKLYGDNWRDHTGYELKDTFQAQPSADELRTISCETFPAAEDLGSWARATVERVKMQFLNTFKLLSFIDRFAIPGSDLESFFDNNLGQILGFVFQGHAVLVDLLLRTLSTLRFSENFDIILAKGFKSLKVSEDDFLECQQWPQVFKYFCTHIEDLCCVRAMLRVMCELSKDHLLLHAINFNLVDILEIYKSHLAPCEIANIHLRHNGQFFYLKDPRPENFRSFFAQTTTPSDCVRLANDESNKDFERARKKCEIIVQILMSLARVEIPQEILRQSLSDHFDHICWFVLRSRSSIEMVFEIFAKNFGDSKPMVAAFVRNGVNGTGFLNPKLLSNRRITAECQSLIDHFWSRVEVFLDRDQALMRTILLGQFRYKQPLIMSIYYGIESLKGFYFKYCDTKEILESFTTNLNSIGRYFDTECFEAFFRQRFRAVELRHFIESFRHDDGRTIYDVIDSEKERLKFDHYVSKEEKVENFEKFCTLLNRIANENVKDEK